MSAEPAEIDRAGARFLTDALEDHPRLRQRVLSLVHDIRIRPDIDTARVRIQGGRFLLEISPRFVATMLPTPGDKRFVLLHEVTHLERGDLLRAGRFYRRFPRMVNFAMDIYVNGAVLGAPPFDARSPGVLDRLYDPRTRPACLLQPPWRLLQAWAAEVEGAEDLVDTARAAVRRRRVGPGRQRSGPTRPLTDRLVAALAKALSRAGFRNAPEAARLYLGGWTGTLPFSAFLERFHALLGQEALLEAIEGRPLVFEHDLEALAEALRRTGGLRPGVGTGLRQETVSPDRDPWRRDAMRPFYGAIRAALAEDPSNPSLRRDAAVMFPSVLLHIGRREAALLATGALPVLFNAPAKALALSDERVHLYLDVSRSMDDTLAFVTGLTLYAGSLIGPTLQLFSNEVVTITWQELQQGHIVTTGGTDLDCVADHARAQGYHRILIVTDGLVRLSDESRRFLKRRVETFVVLVNWYPAPPSTVTDECAQFARHQWVLPTP